MTSSDLGGGAIVIRVPRYAYRCYLALINSLNRSNAVPLREKRGGYTHRFHSQVNLYMGLKSMNEVSTKFEWKA